MAPRGPVIGERGQSTILDSFILFACFAKQITRPVLGELYLSLKHPWPLFYHPEQH